MKRGMSLTTMANKSGSIDVNSSSHSIERGFVSGRASSSLAMTMGKSSKR